MEGMIQVVTAIKTNFQAGESIEPTVRSFDGPADHAQAAAVRMAAAGDLRSHPQTVQCQAMSTRVVTAVGEESSWSLAWTTDLAFDGGNGFDHRRHFRHVVPVGTGDCDGQRRTVAIGHEMPFRAAFAVIPGFAQELILPRMAFGRGRWIVSRTQNHLR